MKKIVISLFVSLFSIMGFSQSLDISGSLKEINKILIPNSNSKIIKNEPIAEVGELIENKRNISTHRILDKVNSIVKIQVQSRLGKEKIAVGSGSIIREDGLIVTNYHVISNHFADPANNKIVFSVGKSTEEIVANLEAVDLVNDLALIKPIASMKFQSPLEIEKNPLQLGEKIYSLGFPHNWSMTMIDGIYNGYMEKQIIFHYIVSHALSSGMSGGPTFNEDGKLVAINVAATNKLSILIPVISLTQLLGTYTKEQKSYPVQEQYIQKINLIRDNAISRYSDFSNILLEQIVSSEVIEVGKFKLPFKNKLFECWSRNEGKESNNLDKVEMTKRASIMQTERSCSTQDSVFLQETNQIGEIMINTFYYQNNSATSFAMWKTIEKKFNVVALQNESLAKRDSGSCFYNNVTNKNKKLQKMQICISPLKETNKLWKVQVSQIYQDGFNQALILDFMFDGFTEKSINKIIEYVKKI